MSRIVRPANKRLALFDHVVHDRAEDDRKQYEQPLTRRHGDYGMVEPIVAALLRHANGWENFAHQTAALMRRAVDEVIDTARTNRFTLSETEKTEKTYLGTKVEILFRSMLGLSKGHLLDLNVDGVDVDIKNTMGSNWAIPDEAVRRPCVLIAESELKAVCSVGVIIAHENYLNAGKNKDGKRTISADGRQNIWWILRDFPYPANPWELLPEKDRLLIMKPRGGTDRVAALFEMLQERAVSRTIVEHVAQQKDALKRVRFNGGARDLLAPKGIAILYGGGGNDRALIAKLGLPPIGQDDFISYKAQNEREREMLRRAKPRRL